jgi:mxaJ protein
MTLRVTIAALVLVCARTAWTDDRVLRVCADPNNLPFSNQREEGFENRIAQLLAGELHATVQYTWRPQRRGYVRRTLTAGDCDVMIGVPTAAADVLATAPYYRSTYVFVSQRRRHLALGSFDNPALRSLTIGLHAIAEDGANTPPTHALARRGIVGHIVGYKMWDEDAVESPSGAIISAVGSGDIDVAIVWGPFAGYFASRQPVDLDVLPVSPEVDPPGLFFAFDVSMGVKRGNDALKRELDGVLDRRRADIRQILEAYGVPLAR